MSHKKRGQSGWVGKKEAKSKEYRERQYAKDEVMQALQEELEGEDYRHKKYRHEINEEAKIKSQIKKNEYFITWYERTIDSFKDSWFNQHADRLKSDIKKLKEKLKNIMEKK